MSNQTQPGRSVIDKVLAMVVVALLTAAATHESRITRLESGQETQRLIILKEVTERVDAKLEKISKELSDMNRRLDTFQSDMRSFLNKPQTAWTTTNFYNTPIGGLKDNDYFTH